MRLYTLVMTATAGVHAANNTMVCSEPSSGPVMDGIDLVDTKRAILFGKAPVYAAGTDFSYTDEDGFEFRFNSADNRDEFQNNPSFYELAAGGFCPYAASGQDPACDGVAGEACNGPACLTDEDSVEVIESDGKMYFFLGKGALSKFMTAGADIVEDTQKNTDEALSKSSFKTCLNTELFKCKS